MTFLINKLNRKENEQGSSMIFAILVLMIFLFATVIVASTAVTSASTSKELTSREVLRMSAEAGLENALLNANNNSSGFSSFWTGGVSIGPSNVVTGTLATSSVSGRQTGEVKWEWHAESLGGTTPCYYVYSTGYSTQTGGKAKGVSLRTQMCATAVESATVDADGTPNYFFGMPNLFQLGVTGTNSIVVKQNALIRSSNGRTPSSSSNPSTGSSISTNGTLKIGSGTGVKELNFTSSNQAETCEGAGCTETGISQTYRGFNVNFGATDDATVWNKCPLSSYPEWKASENGGVWNLPDGACVGSIKFDVNTVFNGGNTETTPLSIHNIGPTEVSTGVTVNSEGKHIRIYSGTGSLNVGATTGGSTPTTTFFYFATAGGSCNIGNVSNSHKTKFFGALACNNIALEQNAELYIDLEAKKAALGSGSIICSGKKCIWNKTYIEEL